MLSPEFRAWLRGLMNKRGLSVNALALAADVHQSLFNSGLLGNKNISNETLEKIAEHLGLSPEYLTTLADLDRIGGIERVKQFAPDVLQRGTTVPPVVGRTTNGAKHVPGVTGPYKGPIRMHKSPNDLTFLINVTRANNNIGFPDFVMNSGVAPEILIAMEEEEFIPSFEVLRDIARALSLDINELTEATRRSLLQLTAGPYRKMEYPPTARELKLLARIGAFDGGELDPRSGSPLWMVTPDERWPELRQAAKDWGEANGANDATVD